MDPVTIGTVAVGLLAPYMVEAGTGAAKVAGEQGLQKVEDLIATIRGSSAARKTCSDNKHWRDWRPSQLTSVVSRRWRRCWTS